MISTSIDHNKIQTAYETVRDELLKHRDTDGHWVGCLADSALSTATAVSALSIYFQRAKFSETPKKDEIKKLIRDGVNWIIADQNHDGGWGDTPHSPSNISTTLLVNCAILLSLQAVKSDDDSRRRINETTVPDSYFDVLTKTDAFILANGGIAAIPERYGNDKTFSIPILTNAALAGLVSWKDVPSLPFELAAFPQSLFRIVKMPVVSYAIPALVAIGRVIFEHRPCTNFFAKLIRKSVANTTLEKIRKMQPESGGYLEATPLTAFVVMSLSACNLTDHEVVVNGLRFLANSVRKNGAWPIDTNLATWATTLSISALAIENERYDLFSDTKLARWLISCQHRTKHPFTGAAPGGWAWTDLSGGVPDADDTPGALLAIAEIYERNADNKIRAKLTDSAVMGIRWLISLQNKDGGWPTFCRGWNRFPFDRSGVDLTAHAVRAFIRWKDILLQQQSSDNLRLVINIDRSISRGADYLLKSQKKDGSWLPLWFGNQYQPNDENPVYGTAKALIALGMLNKRSEFQRDYSGGILDGVGFALSVQNADGGWGYGAPFDSDDQKISNPKSVKYFPTQSRSGFEETAIMLDALISVADFPGLNKAVSDFHKCVDRALTLLVERIEKGEHLKSSPIGLYFTKLWYDEKLYPIIFAVAALGRVLKV